MIAMSIKVTGLEQSIQKLEGMKRGLRNRHLRKAVRAAVAPQVKQVKASMTFADDTGVLRRSITSKIKTYPSGYTMGVVGPRAQTLTAHSRSKNRQVSRNPAKYTHLVEFGHRIAKGGALRNQYATEWTVVNGKRRRRRNMNRITKLGLGSSSGYVQGRPFLGPGFDRSSSAALDAFKSKLVDSLNAEARV